MLEHFKKLSDNFNEIKQPSNSIRHTDPTKMALKEKQRAYRHDNLVDSVGLTQSDFTLKNLGHAPIFLTLRNNEDNGNVANQ